MPDRAAAPVPTIRAVGVARPSAHGQAMTRTLTALTMAASAPAPASHQPASVAAAIAITVGTNTAETRSTSRCTGALVAWASSTMRTMRDRAESAPTWVAWTCSRPSPLIEPPITPWPASRATGSPSPVISDSSRWLWPFTMSPSTGTRSPGRTTTIWPAPTLSAGTSTSTPSRSTRAVSGRRAISARIAWVVERFARASSHFPRRTRVMTAAAPSKYRCDEPWSHSHTDRTNAAVVPRATRTSMFAAPPRSARQPPT